MTTVRELYHVDGLPLFQNKVFDSQEAALGCQRGDVDLVESLATGLVYNAAFRPELMEYDSNYNNEQAESAIFRSHLQEVSGLLEQTLGREGIVEVGCGKGYFLEMLLEAGFDISGFDPTYEGNNPRVVKEYFQASLGIKARGLILRHVLEHILDPVDFLGRLRDANGGGGLIYIEVPCFDWVCAHRAWFDVFYEHVNYFRLSDFHRMFGVVPRAQRTFGGQYLSVVADLASLKTPERDPKDAVPFPDDFVGRNHIEPDGPFAVWGAGSKGVLFSIMMARAGFKPDLVIDINPKKQNKYLPVTGLRISSPTDAFAQLTPGSTLYVMNSNYMDEIREISMNKFHYVGIDG